MTLMYLLLRYVERNALKIVFIFFFFLLFCLINGVTLPGVQSSPCSLVQVMNNIDVSLNFILKALD